ncbi:hypothetical protein NC651_002902 [Populus alba x Populus x berolinensis]|nr:hypothetical protein NC651_002902 [Populus alba x Populus x berolinensis]
MHPKVIPEKTAIVNLRSIGRSREYSYCAKIKKSKEQPRKRFKVLIAVSFPQSFLHIVQSFSNLPEKTACHRAERKPLERQFIRFIQSSQGC